MIEEWIEGNAESNLDYKKIQPCRELLAMVYGTSGLKLAAYENTMHCKIAV
jgi:hypothetical protein